MTSNFGVKWYTELNPNYKVDEEKKHLNDYSQHYNGALMQTVLIELVQMVELQ